MHNKQYHIDASVDTSSIPPISHVAIKKLMKKSVFAYLIFAKESEGDSFHNVMSHENMASNMSPKDQEHMMFLKQFDDCFIESGELPPIRPEDHRIDLI